MKKAASFIAFLGLFLIFSACADNAVTDFFTSIPKERWAYDKPIKTVVEINDTTKAYNIYINFRHTEDYRYANLWLKISQSGPQQKKTTERKEFGLALPDGTWIGKGSGNLYSYRLIFKEHYHFPRKGKYAFVVEQNMRDNPLKSVTDVGLRIEEDK